MVVCFCCRLPSSRPASDTTGRPPLASAMKLLYSASVVSAAGSAVTPVQKVIEMMNGMLEKGKKEKHEEQVQFAAYKQFCDVTTVEKT